MSALVRLLRRPGLVLVAQLVIAVVFLAAALGKIGDPGAFARQIHHFRLLPFGLENLLAITLPWVELLAALALLLRYRPRAGAVVTAGLMGLFVFVVAAAVARGLDIECGCFGTADASRVGTAKLIENVGLLALALIASLKPGEPQAATVERTAPAPDRVTV
ncbi:MAG: MauE/DoxX family redox-associated membrane protein [Candidatus Eiseniibacteriota bacterium]